MYDKFYGYSTLPFRLSPDPAFFYGSKGHRRALAYLRYGLQQREGFIVITGNPGTGKTTIARALLQEISKEKIIVAELNNTHLRADDVLRMVAASFGLEHENLQKASLLKRLETFFQSKYRAGYHCLLLIDEAQNLPFESLEELRMLSNFYQGKHALLQIFLMGQQQFRDTLYSAELEQLRQRVVAATHLDPLDEVEGRDYIIHRLKRVGWKGTNPAFSKRAFAHIYTLTKGIPRRINTFCDRLLLYASIEEKTVINDAIVRAVARELIFEISHRSQAVSQPHDEVLKDVNDVDSELDSTAESDFEMVSPDDISKEFQEESEATSVQPAQPVQEQPSAAPPIKSAPTAGGNAGASVRTSSTGVNATSPSSSKPVAPERNNLRLVATAEQKALAPQIENEFVTQPVIETSGDEVLAAALKSLEYYRNPDRFPDAVSSSMPLPKGSMLLIQIALGKWVPNKEQEQRLAISNPNELRDAARYFIKNVWLSTTADYYRRLGLDRGANEEAIREHYRALFRLFQPDSVVKGESWDKAWAQKVNQANSVLRDAGKRKAYDQFLNHLNDTSGVSVADTRQNTVIVRNDSMPTQIGDVFLEQDVFAQSEISPQQEQALARGLAGHGHTKSRKNRKVALFAGSGMVAITLLVGAYVYLQRANPVSTSPNMLSTGESDSFSDVAEPPVQTQPPQIESSPVKTEDSRKTIDIAKTESPQKPVAEEAPPKTKESKKEKTESAREPKQETSKVVAENKEPVKAPAEESTTARSKSNDMIQQSDLKAFINRFALSYEEADVDTLMSLFSADATTNDSQNKADIRKDYVNLFRSSDMRVIDISNLNWKINQNKAMGQGDFKVTVLRKGGKDMRSFVGTIQFTVERGANNNLAIKEIYHAYSMDERQ